MEKRIERARYLLQLEKYDLARQELVAILADYPGDSTVLAHLAYSMLMQGNVPEATKIAGNAIAANPESEHALYIMASVWIKRNDLDKAIAIIRDAIAISPETAHYHVILASCLSRQGDWKAAAKAAQNALALDPEDIKARNILADCMSKAGLWNEATTQLQETLNIAPADSITHLHMGRLYAESGYGNLAQTHVMESLRIDPDRDEARDSLLNAMRMEYVIYRMIFQLVHAFQKLDPRIKRPIARVIFFTALFSLFLSCVHVIPFRWCLPFCLPPFGFVFIVYTARPLTNVILLFRPRARLAINFDEKLVSLAVLAVTLASALCVAGVLLFGNLLLSWAFFFAWLLMPLVLFLRSGLLRKNIRMQGYVTLTVLTGLCYAMMATLNHSQHLREYCGNPGIISDLFLLLYVIFGFCSAAVAKRISKNLATDNA